MAESSTQQQEQSSGNGSEGRKTALRAAAIAAASGATAIAAKRAFSGSQQSEERRSTRQSNGSGDSLMGGVLGSGWHAAKDSLVPFAEDAATAAGEYLGRSGPDFVRETIVPAFIEGFQSGQKSSGGE